MTAGSYADLLERVAGQHGQADTLGGRFGFGRSTNDCGTRSCTRGERLVWPGWRSRTYQERRYNYVHDDNAGS